MDLSARVWIGTLFAILSVITWQILRAFKERKIILRYGNYAPSVTPAWSMGLPFVADVLNYALSDQNLQFNHKYFSMGCTDSTYRTFETRVLGTRYIFTADPRNIKAILATQFGDYGKGDRFRKDWKDFLGSSIFAMDGELWHTERRLVGSILTKQRMSDLDCFERHLAKVVPLFDVEGAVDVKTLFARFTMAVQSDFTMGKCLDIMNESNDRFTQAFEAAIRTQSLIERTGPLNFLIPRRKFLANIKWVRDYTRPIVNNVLSIPPEELEKIQKSDDKFSFLHALAKFSRDPELLGDQVMTTLFAGRDTTAMTMAWMFFELARCPDLVRELREEIGQTIGLVKRPSYNELKNLKLVQSTVNETLRLYPAVPLNGRAALTDTNLPRGGGPDGSQPIGVPAGTMVLYSTHILHLDPDNYPSDSADFPPVHLFRPKRWLRWTPTPWTYVPFNGGPRICVGQGFALTQMSYVLVRLLQVFNTITIDPEVQLTPPTGEAKPSRPWFRSRGVPSAAEKFVEATPTMASEIILLPREALNVSFSR